MQKTIKELADELNVSKRKIEYRVQKLDTNLYTKKDNIVYLGEEAVKLITTAIIGNNTQTKKSTREHDKSATRVQQENASVQLEKKDEQILELQNIIKQNQKLLDQQQQLHQQANQRIEKLEQQLALEVPKETKDSSTSKELELQAEKLKRKEAEIKKLKAEVEELDHANNLWYEQDQERKKKENAKKWYQFWKN